MLSENNKMLDEEEFIDLSEPDEEISCSGSTHYMYKENIFFFKVGNDRYSTIIAGDVGYKPIIIYRDFLIDKLGFTLENDYGLTDMIQEYTYKGNTYYLKYLSYDLDCISWEIKIPDGKIPKTFLDVAIMLDEIDISEYI